MCNTIRDIVITHCVGKYSYISSCCLQVISVNLDSALPLERVISTADTVIQHTSPQAQTSIKHDLNNANIELEQTKTELKQKIALLDEYIVKLKV